MPNSHCCGFGPRPMNLKSNQDTVKLHAIALMSMTTNANVTVLLHNLLHMGLTQSTATDVLACLIFQHLFDPISALFRTFPGLIFQCPKMRTFQVQWEPCRQVIHGRTTTSLVIGWEELLQNDLFCVELDVKPNPTQSVHLLQFSNVVQWLQRRRMMRGKRCEELENY